jgi:FAD/FMN-containing dehydrogenase/Fe-S oxidoreductase
LQAAVELAAKHRVPLVARGSGTSLAGQAIGNGLILDCSRWLDGVLELDPDRRVATVEPGVVLAALNRAAARHGLQFGPDPASAERATMGGVIANNATGAHSILYGMAADHLRSAEVLLSDGSEATLAEMRERPSRDQGAETGMAFESASGQASSARYAAILKAARDIRERMAEEVRTGFPRTWRNSAGYRINYLLPWSPSAPAEWIGRRYPGELQPGSFNLSHLLAGSEGTLAIIARATVNLVPIPKHTILGILAYSSVAEACDAVPELLQSHPSAVELLPQMILRLARTAPAFASQMDWVKGDPSALLVVEFSGDDAAVLRARAKDLGRDVLIAESSADQAKVWNIRKVGLGILDSRPQRARPVAFIEDCAIPVEKLGEFVREIQRILAEHGTEGGIYAHASAGCLHVKPVLDLQTKEGTRSLRTIAADTTSLALRLGGSMSSEHGDGIARGEWLRQTYGEDLLNGMKSLKRAADPDSLLNPGKMLDAPPMDTHLRYGAEYQTTVWAPGIDFKSNGGLAMAIEQCNGQGICRKDTGMMCPSFQATRDEMHSTRGRANLLRALIVTSRAPGAPPRTAASVGASAAAGQSGQSPRHVSSKAVYGALDLCLGCKACKAECPSGVDMAKLKSEFLNHYYSTHRRPLRDYLFGYFHVTARLLSACAPIVNTGARLPPARGIMARALQITPFRPVPAFRMRSPRPRSACGDKPVLFLRDPFNHCVDTEVEQAAFDLLGAAGFKVRTLGALGAGASLVSKGFLAAARRHARRVVHELARADPAGVCPVLVIEPSELSALRHDYPDLLADMPTRIRERLSQAVSVEEFLVQSGGLNNLRIATTGQQVAIHPHCHQKAEAGSVSDELGSGDASMELLRACGYEVQLIEAGCCGMAGTFGYEAEHYELSQKIAEMHLFPRIRELPGALIAATGAACRMQISQGTGAVAEHPLVLAAKTISR